VEKKRKRGDEPCPTDLFVFINIPPSPSFSFVRSFVRSPVCFFRIVSFTRSFARVVRSSDETARVSFVSYARSDAFSTSSPLSPPSVRHLHCPRRLTTGENQLDKRNEFKRKGWRRRKRARKGGSFIFFLHSSRRRRRRTHARARDGTEDEDYQSPSLSRCISLSTTRENKRAVSRRSGVSPETRLALSRMETIRRAFVSRRVRSFIFIFLRTPFERGSS